MPKGSTLTGAASRETHNDAASGDPTQHIRSACPSPSVPLSPPQCHSSFGEWEHQEGRTSPGVTACDMVCMCGSEKCHFPEIARALATQSRLGFAVHVLFWLLYGTGI